MKPSMIVVDTAVPSHAAARMARYLAEQDEGRTRICVLEGKNPLEAIGLTIATLIVAWSSFNPRVPLSFIAGENGDIAVSPTPVPTSKEGGAR